MANQWGPRGKGSIDLKDIALGIIIIGVIVYLLFPSFFGNVLTSISSTLTTTNELNQPLSTNSSTPNETSPLVQSTTSINDPLGTGYWILFVLNGTSQQLSVSASDFTFIKDLIQKDTGSKAVRLLMVDNGQIAQFLVSNEIYSVICNLATVNTRTSDTASNPTTPTTPVPAPTETISETLTISNPTTTGFTVEISPALNGLTTTNFTLVNSLQSSVTITNVTTSNNGAAYQISASLSQGQTYSLTAAASGYTFGTPQTISVP